MIEREVSEQTLRKEHTMEILKDAVGWVVVTALAFVYWLVMLLFASLVLAAGVFHYTYRAVIGGVSDLYSI